MAISANHTSLVGMSVGRDPLIVCFLHGTLSLRPTVHSRVLSWDLAIVQEGLSVAPFEPIEEVAEKVLILKLLFLLAIKFKKIWGPTSPVGFSFLFGLCSRYGQSFSSL